MMNGYIDRIVVVVAGKGNDDKKMQIRALKSKFFRFIFRIKSAHISFVSLIFLSETLSFILNILEKISLLVSIRVCSFNIVG